MTKNDQVQLTTTSIVLPLIQISEQRLADQNCLILRINLIPRTRLNRIKRRLEQEIHNHLRMLDGSYMEILRKITK